MVNRHGWRFYGAAKWQALDLTEIPEGKPVRAKAGAQTLVLVRNGETSTRCTTSAPTPAARSAAARSWTPASSARSTARSSSSPPATGIVGPTVYDQPRFEVRRTDAGGYEARRVTVGSGGSEKAAEAA